MFLCEGLCPRRHRENMQTHHRKALSPTPPRVWVLMTRVEEHAPSAHSFPLRECVDGCVQGLICVGAGRSSAPEGVKCAPFKMEDSPPL